MVDDVRFEEIWTRYGASVTRFCVFSSGSPCAGEDIAAETFARFLTRGESIPAERTEAWLFTVARNLCASHHRSAARARRLATLLGDQADARGGDVAPSSEQLVTDGALDPGLAGALRRLSADARLAVYLRGRTATSAHSRVRGEGRGRGAATDRRSAAHRRAGRR